MADPFKLAIATICVRPKDDVPLEPPPMSSEESGLVCPGCGNMNASKVQVENALVARCPDCQGEWPMMSENLQSRLVLDLLVEQRRSSRMALELLT